MQRSRSRKLFLTASFGRLAATGAAASCVRKASAADSYTLRLSIVTSTTSTLTVSAIRWASAVGRRSNGRLKIEVYPDSQLAKEPGAIEGLNTGFVDLTIGASVFLEPLFPQLQALTLPFMFKDAATAFRVVDGPIGNEYFSQFEAKGILGLGWGTSGFRQMETVTKAIRVPEDMRGLRYRIQGGAVGVGMAQALGTIPVTIDFAEIYTSLVQHTIDLIDSTPDTVLESKFYTVVKNMALTNHVFAFLPLLGSKRKIESLPPDLQKILKDEAKVMVPLWRSLIARRSVEAIETLKSRGMNITEIQYPVFRRAMDPVYAALQSKLGGDLVQRMSRAAGAT
jgi:TRAP-type transport system periplasmic protein